MQEKRYKILTVFRSVFISILIISFSISLPVLLRPFYYAHIEYLELEEKTGLEASQIRQAYNEVMNYCTGLQPRFSAGVFPFSASGAAHFQDVRNLFGLDFIAMIFSLAFLLILGYFSGKRKISEWRFFNRGALFYGPFLTAVLFIGIGLLAALDFNSAFRVFHQVLFPGKGNWEFAPDTDPVITVLPEVFFRNCAVLILVCLILCCIISMLLDKKYKIRK